MRKIIGAIHMTLDGYFDHTAILPDEALHQHYADLLSSSDIILYGRITFGLMEYWKEVVAQPTGVPATDAFARIMDRIPKLVFSRSLEKPDWETAQLAKDNLEQEAMRLRKEDGRPVLAGSRSIIIQLMELGLLDELQLCVHPVIAGSGKRLFENETQRKMLQLTGTKNFDSGAILLYYKIHN